MTPVPRPEQGAATLRLTEEEWEQILNTLDDACGVGIPMGLPATGRLRAAVESILAARQSDTGLREAVEARVQEFQNAADMAFPDDAHDHYRQMAYQNAAAALRADLAAHPAAPEPEATEVEEWHGDHCSGGCGGACGRMGGSR